MTKLSKNKNCNSIGESDQVESEGTSHEAMAGSEARLVKLGIAK